MMYSLQGLEGGGEVEGQRALKGTHAALLYVAFMPQRPSHQGTTLSRCRPYLLLLGHHLKLLQQCLAFLRHALYGNHVVARLESFNYKAKCVNNKN